MTGPTTPGEPSPGATAAPPSPPEGLPRLPPWRDALAQAVLATVSPITTAELTAFTRQLGALLRSAIPLERAIEILEEFAETTAFKELLREIRPGLAAGVPLSRMLERHAEIFPIALLGMIRAGEAGGGLAPFLDRAADDLEMVERFKTRVRQSFLIPGTLAGAVFFIFLVTVVYHAGRIFVGMRLAPTILTSFMFGCADLFYDFWTLALPVFLFFPAVTLRVLFWAKDLHSLPGGRVLLDPIFRRLPRLSPMAYTHAVSRFAWVLGTLVAGGVPIQAAIEAAIGAAAHHRVTRAGETLRRSLRKGESLGERVRYGRDLPFLFTQVLAIGGETGQVDVSLDRMATMYAAEVRNSLDRAVRRIPFVVAMTMVFLLVVMSLSLFLSFLALFVS